MIGDMYTDPQGKTWTAVIHGGGMVLLQRPDAMQYTTIAEIEQWESGAFRGLVRDGADWVRETV